LPTAKVSKGTKEHDDPAKHGSEEPEQLCLLDPPPPSPLSLCLKKKQGKCVEEADWLNVSFEIEMYPLASTKELLEPGLEPDDALQKGKDLFQDKCLGSVTREPADSCNSALFSVKKDDDEFSWMFELEKHEKGKPYMFEASSPQAMMLNETEIAITQTAVLDKYFCKHPAGYKHAKDPKNPWSDDPPGLHVHVAAKCLLTDVKRLVAVLLIWEKFDAAIYKITGAALHRGEAGLKAAPIAEKSPAVLKHLLSYIDKDGFKTPSGDDESLGDFYSKHASRKEMEGDKTDADGFRRFEINVCHLLHIKCAHDLPEKEAPAVPKFGALEFRGFDPNIGEPLRLIIMLVQRLVQFGCAAPLDDKGKLHELAFWDGKNEAKEVRPLFEALDIPFKAFHHSVFNKAKFAQRPSNQP
jgi:hypothetical protein